MSGTETYKYLFALGLNYNNTDSKFSFIRGDVLWLYKKQNY